MKSSKSTRPAFTLIELLIAVTIFMMLIGVSANLLTTLNSMGSKAISIAEMHQQANEFMKMFNIDMRNMHISTAMSQSFEDPLFQHTTFMMNQKKEQGKAGGSYGPYSMVADQTNYDFMWVRWELDQMNGMINRGRTAGGGFTISSTQEDSLDNSNSNSTSGLRNYHKFAKPQTEYLYFEGSGTAKTGSTAYAWNNDASIGPSERRIMHQHYNFSENVDRDMSDLPLRWDKHYKYNIYSHAVTGNHGLLSNDCFAVKNDDGLTYNKDRLFLLGSPDETPNGTVLYPRKIRPLGLQPNIECSIISYHFADESRPVDHDSMSDGSATIDILGTGPQLRNGSGTIINNRPDYAILSFVLHDIPHDHPDLEDIDNDNSTTSFISALRNKIHVVDGTSITYANYLTEMKDRQKKMLDLIEEHGYIGQLFYNSVAFKK